jgi:hypothetical protein
MRSLSHLCFTVFSMAILVVGTAYEVNGATIPADPLAGEGAVDDNQCSLHEAIAEANTPGTHSGGSGLGDECSPGSAGADIIMLAVGGLYNLTQVDSNHFGDLGLPLVESVISIYGRGSTVRRDPSYVTCDGTYPDFRLFAVSGGGAHLTLDLLTVTNGCCEVSVRGGAVYVDDGARLTVNASNIVANHADGSGGGIGVWNGDTITIRASSISGNRCNGSGGGIWIRSGNLVVNSSTISGNFSFGDGGGVYLLGGDGVVPVNRITFNNSTVADNYAHTGSGTGIYSSSGGSTSSVLTLNNTTVTDNEGGSGGRCIHNSGSGAWVGARNSVVAAQWGAQQDCYNSGGTLQSYGYNVESGTSCGFTAVGDQQNVSAVGLRPLGDYGGSTKTCALDLGSPAIDAGDPAGCFGDFDGDGQLDPVAMDRDQRGSGYWRPRDGDGDGVPRCDTGAVERQLLFGDGFETGDTTRWSSTVQ